MLNTDTKTYEIAMPKSKDYHILCKNKGNARTILTIMTEIDEREEAIIDKMKDQLLKLIRGDKTFDITRNQIHAYGEIDFNKQEDENVIKNLKFLDFLDGRGLHVCANYNYETHSCKSIKRYALYTETWSPLFLSKYAHAALNKPKRVIIFDQYI